jgi:DNA helicase IV
MKGVINMIYIIAILFVILIITMFILYNKKKKSSLNFEGLPLSIKFPILQLELNEQKNYVLCLSTECAHCNQIVDEIKKLGYQTNNVYVAFIEDEIAIQDYIKSKNGVNFEVIEKVEQDDLYIKRTPFMYVLNEKGIILDKGVVQNTKFLDIY